LHRRDKKWARRVWEILNRSISLDQGQFVVDYAKDPFKILLSIILSQNTSEKNSIAAFKRLKEEIGTSPEILANVPLEKLEETIRISGLYKQKAKTIKRLAEEVLHGLDINELLTHDIKHIRQTLLSIEGIGKKTVDVLLAIYGKRIMGIDTHAKRIAIRWGIAKSSNYDEIQRAYVELFDFVDNYDRLHKLIIILGKKFCTSRKPKCDICPINTLCPKLNIE